MTVLEDRQRQPVGRLERARSWMPLAVLAVAVLAGVHAAVVAGHYVVGSFDDDGHYLALARAFADGKGYVDTSAPGSPVESLYPPGYPLLIAPLVALAGDAVWPLRLLSALAFVGCVPLLEILTRRQGMRPAARLAVLVMFALSPVGATFATEVMPEAVFLLVLLLVLLALPMWEAGTRLVSWPGAAVALGAPYLLLLKAAGLPMLVGVVGWLLLRRRLRHALTVCAGAAVMLAPVVIARLAAGPVVDRRYTSEYALAGSLVHAIWSGAVHYVSYAVPASLTPTSGADLLGHGFAPDLLLAVVRYTAAALVVVGWVGWLRRRLDATVVIVPLYLAETLPFPFINERRVVLLLPLVVAWYVLGWVDVGRAAQRLPGIARRPAARYAAVAPAAVVLALLVWQLPRDYLLRLGETTPAARGSGYAAALGEMTPPGWSIATGYRWTFADLTGRTASNRAHFTFHCRDDRIPGDADRLRGILTDEHVATVLDADLKWPGRMDSGCMLTTLESVSWAVPVYHGSDHSTVFVLLGPGTPHDGVQVAAASAEPAGLLAFGSTSRVTEISVELAAGAHGVHLELRRPDGSWVRVGSTATDAEPGLVHAVPADPVQATAVRVSGPGARGARDLVVFAQRRS